MFFNFVLRHSLRSHDSFHARVTAKLNFRQNSVSSLFSRQCSSFSSRQELSFTFFACFSAFSQQCNYKHHRSSSHSTRERNDIIKYVFSWWSMKICGWNETQQQQSDGVQFIQIKAGQEKTLLSLMILCLKKNDFEFVHKNLICNRVWFLSLRTTICNVVRSKSN